MIRKIVVATSLLILASPSLVATPSDIREQFGGSPDLPDGIAYDHFLVMVSATEEGSNMEIEYVADALSITLNSRGKEQARDRAGYFRAALLSMREEIRATTRRVLCPPDFQSRSTDEIFDALNDIDDLREVIATKHYRIGRSGLSDDQRGSFHEYLREWKRSISYTKVDSRAVNTDLSTLRPEIEQRCNELEAG